MEVHYPVNDTVFEASVINSVGDCDVTLKHHPQTPVAADTASYSPKEDDWSDYGHSRSPRLGRRWRFAEPDGISQHVGAEEAFLGDPLLKAVSADPNPRRSEPAWSTARTRLKRRTSDLLWRPTPRRPVACEAYHQSVRRNFRKSIHHDYADDDQGHANHRRRV